MNKIVDEIFDLIGDLKREEQLKVLSQIVRESGLDVAANLIENDANPQLLTKLGLSDYYYSEGNDEAGHISLKKILSEVESVINLDGSDVNGIAFEKNEVRKYTQEELKEEGYANSSIDWYKVDDQKSLESVLIGFKNK